MKKTIIALTSVAALGTGMTDHADAAAHGRGEAQPSFAVETVQPVTSNPTVAKAPAAASAVSGDVAATALSIAAGKTYVYGANSATVVDCSSFAQQVMAALGKSIPRTTYAQMAAGTPVTDPQPGDLVFFNGGSHVGVYIGGGQMVDALNPEEGIAQRSVSYVDGSVTGYYRY